MRKIFGILLFEIKRKNKVLGLYIALSLFNLFSFSSESFAQAQQFDSPTPQSTAIQASNYLKSIKELPQSNYWPNVKPELFVENLKQNVLHPLELYEGSFTNFCGYAALSYLPLHFDPLTYVKFMLALYTNGKANYNGVLFDPSLPVKSASGKLLFKGKLDIRPADQMWFLSLADHFKGYINIFNKHYKPGAENNFWASVNYAKFNRMVKTLFNYNIKAKGSDLVHPSIHDLTAYIQNSLLTGTTVLYLNNAYLLKKNENLKPGIPTHYIILLSLVKESNGLLSISYWDYGYKSLRQLSPSFLKRIVFGVTHCTIK